MHFKTDEILFLVHLTYMENKPPLSSILDAKGKTVGELVNGVDVDALDMGRYYNACINGFDWKNTLTAIRRNAALMSTRICTTHFDQAYGGGGGISVVFINDEKGEAVVAFRGTADYEWADDFVGGNTIDSLQQINALEWYKKVYADLNLEKYYVTIAGHSKGGNKAKYIAILNDTPQRCMAFDGQGFSDRFMEYYRSRILQRQGIIENHNIDFDYVNILLNDIGKKTYYVGFDYGIGGIAEAHMVNTFFNFGENGEYTMEINTNGQRPEMQILDQFLNSLVRSAVSEREKNETNELLGLLVEKAFAIRSHSITVNEFMNYMCDLISDPKYTDNAAYLIAYCVKYSRNVPDFFTAIKRVMEHFHMDAILSVLDMFDNFVHSKRFTAALTISNFLVLHVSPLVVLKVKSVMKKKYAVDLTTEKVRQLLTVVSMTKRMFNDLEIEMDGSDIIVEENEDDALVGVPDNLNIVVLAGGLSNERNRSLRTGQIVAETLSKKHNVILVDSFMGYKDREESIPNAFAKCSKYSLPPKEVSDEIPDLWAVRKRRRDHSNSAFGPNVLQFCKQADLVFIALQGANGENGKIQAAFDLLGINYTGCGYFGSALTFNKDVAKQVMKNHGIPVPKGVCVKKDKIDIDVSEYDLHYPVIVKPCVGGSGLGISAVNDPQAYKKALKEAFRWESEAVVEEYVIGREFSVSVINGKSLPVLEVLPFDDSHNSIVGIGRIKKNYDCPADISNKLEKQLKAAAEAATQCLGLHAFAKVDFIVRDDDTFVCLECDSLPDLAHDSKLAVSANAAGITYDELCSRIIEASLAKQ